LIAAAAFMGAMRAKTKVSASKFFFMRQVSREFPRIATTRPYKFLVK
jgi:hypothetical protein